MSEQTQRGLSLNRARLFPLVLRGTWRCRESVPSPFQSRALGVFHPTVASVSVVPLCRPVAVG
jgi:hypothetical protein